MGDLPTHNLTPRKAIIERIAVHRKQHFVKRVNAHLEIVPDSHHNGPMSRSQKVWNGSNDEKSYRYGAHDGRAWLNCR